MNRSLCVRVSDGNVAASPAPGAEVRDQSWRVLAILSMLMGFASISTDLYLPAIPAMAMTLHANAGSIAWTISSYLIGFAAGQLFWGPFSDSYGRKIPITFGLFLFMFGSAGCALSTSLESMIAWRLVQAAGACAGVTLGRAMVRDLYEGNGAARMMSTLMTVMMIAPLVGPIIGGQILRVVSWPAIFWTLVGIGFATLLALQMLPETLPVHRRNKEPLLRALAAYPELLSNARLLAYAGIGGLFYAGIFAYVAGTPFAYIVFHHVTPQAYGFLFAAGTIGIMLTNMLNARFVVRFGSDRLLQFGASGAAITACIAAFAARTDWGGLLGLAVPLLFFASMAGLIVANSISGALSIFPMRSGAVSAIVGATQYGSGVIGSALVGVFADGTPWPLGWVVAVCGIGAAVCAVALKTGSENAISAPGQSRQ
jgi:MFS transporter, DHA1 family, multidrug resistance protein